jgi:uncharacterized protein DUF1059
VASGANEQEFIASVQEHAKAAHDMDIPAELVIAMAGLSQAQRGTSADPGQQVSDQTTT